ncbi:hypothetical protein AXF42_Ash015416 [Apostasia shenzhenica]|uniref:Cystatin domain-containing protein n=1 Tax=Apostasia shenzhenica TaxID=1088818 RepID=A0A2H9ZS54_9ASPA|nr:hypothetical protein AXF42_Ash015416 [Apostasia shenzhenica]
MAGGRALALFFLIAGVASLMSTVAGNQPSDPTHLTEKELQDFGRFAVMDHTLHDEGHRHSIQFCRVTGFEPVEGAPSRFDLKILVMGEDGRIRVAYALVEQDGDQTKKRLLSFTIIPPRDTPAQDLHPQCL